MKQYEATGKNIEQAIEKALEVLGVNKEDVDIKIINEGGFLKKAKVLVTVSEEETNISENNNEEFQSENFIKDFINKKISLKDFDEKKPQVEDKKNEDLKSELEEKKQVNKIISVEENNTSKNLEDFQDIKPERKIRYLSANEFLNGLLSVLGKNGEIVRKEDENKVTYEILGEDLSELIGKHGECLNNISYIFSLVVNEDNKKIELDIDNYRQQRIASLEKLAVSVANKVARTGRYAKLDPMPANERRIIHMKLANDPRVSTMSKGVEPKRYLMIFPVGEEK